MASQSYDPSGILPLSEAVFEILLALADEDRHGYAIMREVEERTGGKVRLGPGTLYGAIKRLRKQGIVEEAERIPAINTDERRRYYRLTSFGRTVALLEAERLEQLLKTAYQKRLLPRMGSV